MTVRSTLHNLQARMPALPWPNGGEDRALRALRHKAMAAPRHQPGKIELEGFEIEYVDLLSLFFEFKDIFRLGVYDFDSGSPAPRVLDGGGYVGMSVLRAKQQHPGARITCFEPDPEIHEVLRRNVEANGLADVELVQAGLTGAEGSAGFVPDGADGGRIVEGGGEGEIKTAPLSGYLSEPVDFMKLNIEGMELPVLTEAADALRSVREMVIEYHGWEQGPQCLGEILDLLDQRGFRYLVNHMDYETNSAVRPPFRLGPESRWFALIYGKRADLL